MRSNIAHVVESENTALTLSIYKRGLFGMVESHDVRRKSGRDADNDQGSFFPMQIYRARMS